MTQKEMAVETLTISHDATSTISGGVFTIISSPSTKVKGSENGAYETDLYYSFSGGNATGYVPGTVKTTTPQKIPAQGTKVKSNGNFLMRLDDFAIMNAEGTLTGPPPVPDTPISGKVKISDAAQTKVKSE